MAVDTTQIVPLSADMTGPDFIDQLNVNLNLAAQSNSSEEQPGNRDSTEQEQPSGIKKTTYLQMQLGQISTSTGYIICARNQSGALKTFRQYCHTVLMIGIENCKIKDIKVNAGENLYIYYYDSNCEYKGYVYKTNVQNTTNVQNVINEFYTKPEEDRCYIKIVLRKYDQTNYTVLRQLEVTVEGTYTLIKNKTPEAGVLRHFSFATGYPSKAETETTANETYLGAASSEGKNADIVCIENGYIVLPPNYSQEGVPVPLIVFCHGTGGYHWDSDLSVSNKITRIRKFLANNGYAVCDCVGVTSNHYKVSESRFLPSVVSSIAGLIEFIQMNYNVETDGIYVTGKSAGGFACMLLPQIFNVKAAAGLAPTTLTFMSIRPGGATTEEHKQAVLGRNALWEQHNITEVDVHDANNDTNISDQHSYNAYLNVSKLRRYDPLLKSTNITTEELQTLIKYYYESGKKYLHDFIKDVENGSISVAEEVKQKIVNIANKIKITINCPIKIWQSAGDTSVSCVASEMFVEWCKRSGTSAYFRKLNSTYKKDGDIQDHNIVDETNAQEGKTNAIEMVYHTKYGGDMIETVAICEMVDWFNQW